MIQAALHKAGTTYYKHHRFNFVTAIDVISDMIFNVNNIMK